MEKTIIYRNIPAVVIIKDPQEHMQKYWVRGRYYEAQGNGVLNYIYQNEVKSGKYVDIGASIGNHTVFFGKVMRGKVIAFEPQKQSYEHLMENVWANNIDATAYNVALGASSGAVSMLSCSASNVGMYQVVDGDDTVLHPLDMYEDVVEEYDVIKIDVEHYNHELLIGARKVLTNGKGNVYIEAETEDVLKETDAIMNQYDYLRDKELVFNNTPTYLYKKITW